MIVLVLAVLLSGAAYVLLRGSGGGAAGGGRILEFEPSGVTEIVIRRAVGPVQRLVRSADAGEWSLVVSEDGGGESAWPVMAPQVRGLLRILSDLHAEPAARSDADGRAPTVVTLRRGSGGDLEFAVSQTRLSGRVVLETLRGGRSAGTYWVPADVALALAPEGVMMWRDRAVLRGLGPETSRVELTGPSGSVSLARVRGRWGLTAPVVAAASQESVERLVATLAGLRAADLRSRMPTLEPESARATVVSTSRDAEGRLTETERVLVVGPAADMAGKRLYFAVLDGAGPAGSHGVCGTIEAEGLGALTTDPTAYVDRRGAAFPAADVGGVVIGGRGFTRTTRGWTTGPEHAPLLPADADALTSLLKVAAEHSADAVVLAAPAGVAAWRDMELRSLGGDPLARVQIGIEGTASGGGQARVVIRDGDVWRVYAAPGDVEAAGAVLAALDRWGAGAGALPPMSRR